MSSCVSDVIWKYWISLWKKERNKFLTSQATCHKTKKGTESHQERTLWDDQRVCILFLCILCLCVPLFFFHISTESTRAHLTISPQEKCSTFRYIRYMYPLNFSLSVVSLPSHKQLYSHLFSMAFPLVFSDSSISCSFCQKSKRQGSPSKGSGIYLIQSYQIVQNFISL